VNPRHVLRANGASLDRGNSEARRLRTVGGRIRSKQRSSLYRERDHLAVYAEEEGMAEATAKRAKTTFIGFRRKPNRLRAAGFRERCGCSRAASRTRAHAQTARGVIFRECKYPESAAGAARRRLRALIISAVKKINRRQENTRGGRRAANDGNYRRPRPNGLKNARPQIKVPLSLQRGSHLSVRRGSPAPLTRTYAYRTCASRVFFRYFPGAELPEAVLPLVCLARCLRSSVTITG